MFFFGDPSDTAQIYWQQALNVKGPALPDVHFDDYENEQDFKNCLTYLRIALEKAVSDNAPVEVVKILAKEYDDFFVVTAEKVESFKNAVRENRHRPVGGYEKENIKKYKRLAGVE